MNGLPSMLTFRQLPVNPDDGLPQRFSVTIGSRAYDVAIYASLFLGRVETTSTSVIAAGQTLPQTVIPASMKGITVSTVLAVGRAADREVVVVSQVTQASFEAVFRKAHGPWLFSVRSAFHEQDPPDTLYDLAGFDQPVQPAPPPGYLVLRIERRGGAAAQVIFLRKTIPDPKLVHAAEELAVTVRAARIARGNLNGRGSYGSELVIGVAQRWA